MVPFAAALQFPAQYSELDSLGQELKGMPNGIEKNLITEKYRLAGIAFRASIVFAFGLLENNHAPPDYAEILTYRNKIGSEPFKELRDALTFRDKTTELLKNMVEYVDDLTEELIAQEILEGI